MRIGTQQRQIVVFNGGRPVRFHVNVDQYARVKMMEFGQQRGDDVAGQNGLRVDAQSAGQFGRMSAGQGFGFIDVLQNLSYPGQIRLSGFGE